MLEEVNMRYIILLSLIVVLNPTENDREIPFKMTGKSH